MPKKILVITDMTMIGSGYYYLMTNLLTGLAGRGYDITVAGLGYMGEPHPFPFSIIPTPMAQDAVNILNNMLFVNNEEVNLFEYLRNNRLDAPSFFAPIMDGKKQKAPLRYNVFGGTVGGPVRRDRTFFFFSWESFRNRVGASSTFATVPTEEMYRGDFRNWVNASGQMIPVYDPFSLRQEGGRNVRDAFATGAWDTTGLLLDRYDEVTATADRLPYVKGF